MRKHKVYFEDFDEEKGIVKNCICFSSAEGKKLVCRTILQQNEIDFLILVNGVVKAKVVRLKDALQVYNHC